MVVLITMFEDLLLFIIVILGNLVVWFIIRQLHLKKNSSSLILLKIISIIGILIHEVSHFLMCLFTGIKPTGFHLSYRKQEGNIEISNAERITFLQGFLICCAPILIASYIAYLCVYVMFLTYFHIILKFICGIIFISILMHSRPSKQDILIFKRTFSEDPLYSIYQIGILIISGIIIFLINFPLPYYLSFLHYFLIGLLYIVFKYGFLAIRKIFEYFLNKKNSIMSLDSLSNSYRKTIRAKKPIQNKIPRRQW
ncbi:MAG: hypothetical protein EU547_05565 [Promethearchaeota archaeon]|nr:MAG: hypothetical protein EU547_05565 [Candidatus Lokiarchaeota archaeon]